ncbi:MAG: hypothetical protein QM715_07390 [Nibricoccus sp.]
MALPARDQLFGELEKIDLSEAFKALGIAATADGMPALSFPATLGENELLNNALLGETLPAEIANVSPTEDDPMGLFDKHRICLCSAVTGIVTKNGKPVQGAEIVRRLDLIHHQNQVHIDKAVTNANGRFSFKPAYARKWKYVLWEVVTDQKLLIRHEGKLYLGWTNVSHGRDLNEEYCTSIFPPNYIKLDFNGDLSHATPLPGDVDLNRNMTGQGFFNSEPVCVCSYLKILVTLNGEPTQGVKVVRTAEHVGYDNYEQKGITDGDGEVNLDALHAPLLIHKNAKTEIRQKVILIHEGKEYLGWEKTKTNPWAWGEYNLDSARWGLNTEVTAELTDDPQAIRTIETDPERCGKDDLLPAGTITYQGLFKITRYNPGYEKE